MTFEQIIYVFPLAVLANWQLVETWHHGSIFETPRAWVEAHRGSWWAELLLCPFCLSHWTGLTLTIVMFATMENLNSSYAQFAFIYALALTRLPQVLNDLGYSYWRKHSIPPTTAESDALNRIANPAIIGDAQMKDDNLAKLEKELVNEQRKDLENS